MTKIMDRSAGEALGVAKDDPGKKKPLSGLLGKLKTKS
jgi:hypothetical protein